MKSSSNQLITPKSMKYINSNLYVSRLGENQIDDKKSQAADESNRSFTENEAKMTRIDSGSGLN